MPSDPFDVRKAIEQSTSKTTLQELARKGIQRVKVLDEEMIFRLIKEAVDRIMVSRTSVFSEAERQKIYEASRKELDSLIREHTAMKERTDLVEKDKNALIQEVENLQKQLQLERQFNRDEERFRVFTTELERERNELKQQLTAHLEKLDQRFQKVEEQETLKAKLEELASRDDQVLGKLESLLSKTMDGVSKKLESLRLRGVAMGPAGSELEFKPGSVTLDSLFKEELESNLRSIGVQEKATGKITDAVTKLRALKSAKTQEGPNK